MEDASPEDEAASSSIAPELLSHVIQLQDDLRVLIRHVTGRADKAPPPGRLAVAPGAVAAGQIVSYVPADPDFHAGLLVLAPEAIAQDGALLERLYVAVDALTRLAAPANVTSIRLTRAFVEGDVNGEASSTVRAKARRLRRWAWASAAFGLLVFFAAVALLVHVDRGRRAVQQLERVRTEQQAVTNDFTVARAAASDAAVQPECPDGRAEEAPGVQDRAGQQRRALCGRLRDVDLRMSIVHRELLVWNTISERLSYASPVSWLAPRFTPAGGLSEERWGSAELRTSIMMTALTGFVLPMLLGLLGACVYVYREIDGPDRDRHAGGAGGGARHAADAARRHPGRAARRDLDRRRGDPAGRRALVARRASVLRGFQRRGGVPPGGYAGARRRGPDQQAGVVTPIQATGAPCSMASAACLRRSVRSSQPRP